MYPDDAKLVKVMSSASKRISLNANDQLPFPAPKAISPAIASLIDVRTLTLAAVLRCCDTEPLNCKTLPMSSAPFIAQNDTTVTIYDKINHKKLCFLLRNKPPVNKSRKTNMSKRYTVLENVAILLQMSRANTKFKKKRGATIFP